MLSKTLMLSLVNVTSLQVDSVGKESTSIFGTIIVMMIILIVIFNLVMFKVIYSKTKNVKYNKDNVEYNYEQDNPIKKE